MKNTPFMVFEAQPENVNDISKVLTSLGIGYWQVNGRFEGNDSTMFLVGWSKLKEPIIQKFVRQEGLSGYLYVGADNHASLHHFDGQLISSLGPIQHLDDEEADVADWRIYVPQQDIYFTA